MPKDATKNVDRYKIRGGQLNEFDFHQNQEEFAKEKSLTANQLTPAQAAKATKRVKPTKSTKEKKAPTGASAKKLAARKAAKKK